MPVVLWSRRFDGQDRALTDGEAAVLDVEWPRARIPIRLAPSPAEVAARCDVLSIHLALTPETRQIVDAGVLGRLKPGSLVINTARADVVDDEALRAAVHAQRIRVGLDVFAHEPPAATGAFADPIVHEPGVYGTHHIGASTTQAQEAIAAEAVRVVTAFLKTGTAVNVDAGVNGAAKRCPSIVSSTFPPAPRCCPCPSSRRRSGTWSRCPASACR